VLVPKIQGDAVDLHPAIVIFSLVLGGAIAGLLGAIFALPVAAAMRDVYRYLFRRLGDESAPGLSAREAAREFGIEPRPFRLEPKLDRKPEPEQDAPDRPDTDEAPDGKPERRAPEHPAHATDS
jgi:hypothetical protein